MCLIYVCKLRLIACLPFRGPAGLLARRTGPANATGSTAGATTGEPHRFSAGCHKKKFILKVNPQDFGVDAGSVRFVCLLPPTCAGVADHP